MTRIDSQRNRAIHPLHLLMVLGALTISIPTWSQGRPLVITSPAQMTAAPGQTISIKVKVASGEYPAGIGLGGPAIGLVGPVPVSNSSAVLNVTVQKAAPLGPSEITAVGSDSRGELQTSAPITVDVERTDTPTQLEIYPSELSVLAVGDTRPLTIFAVFSGDERVAVMRSTRLRVVSENTDIITVQDGILTAVRPGETMVDVQMGLSTRKISVTVAAAK